MNVKWVVSREEGNYVAELRVYPDEANPLQYHVDGKYGLPSDFAEQCAENTTMRASYIDAFMQIIDFVRDEQRGRS